MTIKAWMKLLKTIWNSGIWCGFSKHWSLFEKNKIQYMIFVFSLSLMRFFDGIEAFGLYETQVLQRGKSSRSPSWKDTGFIILFYKWMSSIVGFLVPRVTYRAMTFMPHYMHCLSFSFLQNRFSLYNYTDISVFSISILIWWWRANDSWLSRYCKNVQ